MTPLPQSSGPMNFPREMGKVPGREIVVTMLLLVVSKTETLALSRFAT